MNCSPPLPFIQTCGPVKRKRRNGGDMAREFVDPETGEVYNVETTRDAKKRHKQNGGQWQPTIGQINAADIRNRQDAKTKRDKENAEKRKRQQERQVAKEAQLKQFQQERLAKGRISIEDTWGKVSASQNRLNKFFAAPKPAVSNSSRPQLHVERQEEAVSGCEPTENDDQAGTEHDTHECKLIGHHAQLGDIQTIEENPKTTNGASALMLPPQQPYIRSPKSTRIASSSLSPAKESPPAKSHTQSPRLGKATSQTNREASHSPSPQERFRSTSPQVIEDALAGLATQDLIDDFETGDANPETDNSEDTPKVIHNVEGDLISLSQTFESLSWPSSIASPDLNEKDQVVLTSAGCELNDPQTMLDLSDENTGEDFFSDDGVDDDDLLALAATQRPRPRPSPISQGHESSAGFTAPLSLTPRKKLGRRSSKQQVSPTCPRISPKVAVDVATQSFNFGDFSDEDLVQCVADFERADSHETSNNMSGTVGVSPRRNKRRRVLPWDKNPLAMKLSSTPEYNLTPSPPDYFDD